MLIGAIIALLIIWIIRSTISKLKNFQKLKKLGIPTRPINVWLGGHLFDVLANNGVSYHKLLLSQLGTVSGFYFSGLPIIMVANYEIIREICIRRSSDFANRCMYFSDMLPEPEEFLQLSLIGIKDSKWKTHRSAISPSFTESKLDQLRPMMIERVYEMLNIIREGDLPENFETR